MKNDLKEILYMGLGAISLTGEKANELKKELLEKGEALYNEGSIKNEELKRNIKEKIKENTNIEYAKLSKDDLIDIIKDLDDDEKKEILNELNNKNNNCENNEEKKESNKNCDCKNNEEKNESNKNCDCKNNEEKKESDKNNDCKNDEGKNE